MSALGLKQVTVDVASSETATPTAEAVADACLIKSGAFLVPGSTVTTTGPDAQSGFWGLVPVSNSYCYGPAYLCSPGEVAGFA